MNDTLKKVDQEGKRSPRRSDRSQWTLSQRMERIETERRLEKRRRERQAAEQQALDAANTAAKRTAVRSEEHTSELQSRI